MLAFVLRLFNIKTPRKYISEAIYLFSVLVVESAEDEVYQPVNRFGFVGSVGEYGDYIVFIDSERQNAEKAFGVGAPFVVFYPDRAFVRVRLLDKIRRRSGMKPDCVFDFNFFFCQGRHAPFFMILHLL